jgi:uncharacterized membrane protein
MKTTELWQQLQQQGLVAGDMPPVAEQAAPWYVRVMLGVAGWIGALFLIGFFGAVFNNLLDDAGAALFIGAMVCVAAYFLFRYLGNTDFGAQFGLAVSMAGQGLVIFGLFDAFNTDTAAVGFSLFGFQALLTLVMPNFIHRVMSCNSAMLALTFAFMRLDIYGFTAGIAAVGFTIIWLNENYWAEHGTLWRPIGYGLAFALLQIDTLNFLGAELHELWLQVNETNWLMLHAPLIGTSLIALILLWVVKHLLDRENIPLNSRCGMTAIIAALLLGVLSFVAHGLVTALLILLLGFATGNRVLMGIGLFALGGFICHYYYQLHHTLLFKSVVLILSGAVLLLIGWALTNYFPLSDNKETSDA